MNSLISNLSNSQEHLIPHKKSHKKALFDVEWATNPSKTSDKMKGFDA